MNVLQIPEEYTKIRRGGVRSQPYAKYESFRNGGVITNIYKRGGHVKALKNAKPIDYTRDSVPCILQPNEIVIPVKYVHLVEPLLTRLGIYENGKFL